MRDYIAYFYQKKPCPMKTPGVPITIDVLDANDNYRFFSTTTSDSSGTYSFQWTYGPSHSVTAFGVDAAPTTTPTPTTVETYFILSVIAIIVAIAMFGALIAMLQLRKRL
jgi:hypothetical protein